MAKKKVNVDIVDNIVPMREDAMNLPENFDTSQTASKNLPDFSCQLVSDTTA